MATMGQKHAIPRTALWFVTVLVAVSAVLFVSGIVVERGSEKQQAPTIRQDTSKSVGSVDSDGGEGGSVSESAPAIAPTAAQTTPDQSESFLGIDPENPWLVGLATLLSLALIAAMFRFGYPILAVIALFAIAAALFDLGEVLRQVQHNNTQIAVLAVLVLLAHGAVVAASILNLYKYRATANIQPPIPL